MTENPKTDRRVLRTQKAIREAFHKLLLEKGKDKITVSALAREADIDRKTFYLHYASIDELMRQEITILVERLTQALTAPKNNPDANIRNNMELVLFELANIVDDNVELYRHVFSAISLDRLVDELHHPVFCIITGHESIDDKRARESTIYIVRFYIAGTLSMFIRWFLNGRQEPIENIVRDFEKAMQPYPSFGSSASEPASDPAKEQS